MNKLDKFAGHIFKSLKISKPAEPYVPGQNNLEAEVGIQKSFITQFAENQNHHQRLFIQFLSSVLIVIVAYAYVYSNTASSHGIQTHKIIPADSLGHTEIITQTKPAIFDTIRHENGSVISYSQVALLSIYIFAQIVLLVLSIMILHMGYSYRRDQVVVSRIRKQTLGTRYYDNIFGTKNFSGHSKGFFEFLPNFNSILFFSICVIQISLFISIFLYLRDFGSAVFLNLEKTDLLPAYNITYKGLRTSLIFPILINLFIYTYYYNKYEFTINNVDTYVPYINKIKVNWVLFCVYGVITVFSVLILLYTFYRVDKYISLWNLTYFFIILYLPIIVYAMVRKWKNGEAVSQFIQGLIYFVAGSVLFYQSYFYFNLHAEYLIKPTATPLLLTFLSVALFVLSTWIGVWTIPNHENALHLYLKRHNRFILVLFYVFILVYSLKLRWLDYAVSCFFAVYSMLIGRRSILRWRTLK